MSAECAQVKHCFPFSPPSSSSPGYNTHPSSEEHLRNLLFILITSSTKFHRNYRNFRLVRILQFAPIKYPPSLRIEQIISHWEIFGGSSHSWYFVNPVLHPVQLTHKILHTISSMLSFGFPLVSVFFLCLKIIK